MNRILFVCTGNTCRSPMAEGLFRQLAAEAGLRVEVRSAGVAARPGSPISENAQRLLQERAAEGPAASSPVTEEAIAWADLVLTMTVGHKAVLVKTFPAALDKTYTLKEFVREADASAAEERDRLAAELALKQALGEQVTDEERRKLMELEREAPDLDVADPYGGSLDRYRACADELAQHLRLLADKLKRTQS
ncbi:low molecular weight protein arginine phosphatase [Paenibacillus thermoaerophilus]|jgi:protein-tyrosine-phosphatase|uniref:Low molecular weight protein arginine phosphatase n=1 Tax=Paenibacillus thermoaerophilus TaxID=1215385 RepID=A0ABW2V6U1_9BACL|nr:low molecular weight protein arginine phosphatase [Paenibacillus thermoaerophilus]TMV12469.1 low molecular weight protein arginine phosphatase [Paenibacillus thermoaerophilus]